MNFKRCYLHCVISVKILCMDVHVLLQPTVDHLHFTRSQVTFCVHPAQGTSPFVTVYTILLCTHDRTTLSFALIVQIDWSLNWTVNVRILMFDSLPLILYVKFYLVFLFFRVSVLWFVVCIMDSTYVHVHACTIAYYKLCTFFLLGFFYSSLDV